MSNTGMKPEVSLTEGNYLDWNRQWKLYFGGYGMAGKELSENRYIRNQFRRPIIGAMIREQQRVDGEDVWVDREITNADLKQLPARQAEYDSAQEKYERSRGQLIVNILNSVENSLLIYIQNQSSFDEIITDNDHLKLWNLIKTVNNTKGGSQVELIQKWRNLKQTSDSLSNHLNLFEQLYVNIDTAAAGITPRAKAEQLIRSVNFQRYNSILANYYLQLEQPVEGEDTFPTYNNLKDKLLRYDEILIKNQPSNVESKTEETIFFTKEKKMNITCYNCGEKGHIAKHCPNNNRQFNPTKMNVDNQSNHQHSKSEFKFKRDFKNNNNNNKHSSRYSMTTSRPKTFKKQSSNLKSKFITDKKPNKVFRMIQIEDENEEEDTESDTEEVEDDDEQED
jgi:hypothetical protein